MNVYTIGFTKKNAAQFFEMLKSSGAKRIVDVRLNNISQLAGFSKRDDLAYFARTICTIEYVHLPMLAPTQDILDAYKKNNGDWAVYEQQFLRLMQQRDIARTLDPSIIADGCLLCSEDTPTHCHRRLVLEYLASHWGPMQITHLH
ncbi:MAG: DUF488 family protein [Roseiflexaceae bacterium]|jgi:uncharacterized protein (DUF488 family)|nr:DUF488 domain-containing protein [Chloroflexaceae bacterium]